MKLKFFANMLAVSVMLSSFQFGIFSTGENEHTQNGDISYSSECDTSEIARYSGIEESETVEEKISYHHKTTDEYFIPGNLPTYYADQSTSNCANIAGAEIIAYYDKTYEALIPNYQVYTQLGTTLFYRTQSSYVVNVIHELYTLMGTDVNGAGTTFSGFEKGMKQYALNHGGFTYKSENLKSQGKFNLGSFKNAVEAQKPVAIFLSDYTIIKSMYEEGSTDTIYTSYETLAHVVAACGYRTDTYYNENGNVIDTRTYLKVASGFKLTGLTYIQIDKSSIDEAISIIIS